MAQLIAYTSRLFLCGMLAVILSFAVTTSTTYNSNCSTNFVRFFATAYTVTRLRSYDYTILTSQCGSGSTSRRCEYSALARTVDNQPYLPTFTFGAAHFRSKVSSQTLDFTNEGRFWSDDVGKTAGFNHLVPGASATDWSTSYVEFYVANGDDKMLARVFQLTLHVDAVGGASGSNQLTATMRVDDPYTWTRFINSTIDFICTSNTFEDDLTGAYRGGTHNDTNSNSGGSLLFDQMVTGVVRLAPMKKPGGDDGIRYIPVFPIVSDVTAAIMPTRSTIAEYTRGRMTVRLLLTQDSIDAGYAFLPLSTDPSRLAKAPLFVLARSGTPISPSYCSLATLYDTTCYFSTNTRPGLGGPHWIHRNFEDVDVFVNEEHMLNNRFVWNGMSANVYVGSFPITHRPTRTPTQTFTATHTATLITTGTVTEPLTRTTSKSLSLSVSVSRSASVTQSRSASASGPAATVTVTTTITHSLSLTAATASATFTAKPTRSRSATSTRRVSATRTVSRASPTRSVTFSGAVPTGTNSVASSATVSRTVSEASQSHFATVTVSIPQSPTSSLLPSASGASASVSLTRGGPNGRAASLTTTLLRSTSRTGGANGGFSSTVTLLQTSSRGPSATAEALPSPSLPISQSRTPPKTQSKTPFGSASLSASSSLSLPLSRATPSANISLTASLNGSATAALVPSDTFRVIATFTSEPTHTQLVPPTGTGERTVTVTTAKTVTSVRTATIVPPETPTVSFEVSQTVSFSPDPSLTHQATETLALPPTATAKRTASVSASGTVSSLMVPLLVDVVAVDNWESYFAAVRTVVRLTIRKPSRRHYRWRPLDPEAAAAIRVDTNRRSFAEAEAFDDSNLNRTLVASPIFSHASLNIPTRGGVGGTATTPEAHTNDSFTGINGTDSDNNTTNSPSTLGPSEDDDDTFFRCVCRIVSEDSIVCTVGQKGFEIDSTADVFAYLNIAHVVAPPYWEGHRRDVFSGAFPIENEDAPRVPPFFTVINIMSAVVVIGALVVGGPWVEFQCLMLLLRSGCSSWYDREASRIAMYFVAPIGELAEAAEWGVLGNVLIALLVAAVHAVVNGVLWRRRTDFFEQSGQFRNFWFNLFPSSLHSVGTMLYPGVCYWTLCLILGSAGDGGNSGAPSLSDTLSTINYTNLYGGGLRTAAIVVGVVWIIFVPASLAVAGRVLVRGSGRLVWVRYVTMYWRGPPMETLLAQVEQRQRHQLLQLTESVGGQREQMLLCDGRSASPPPPGHLQQQQRGPIGEDSANADNKANTYKVRRCVTWQGHSALFVRASMRQQRRSHPCEEDGYSSDSSSSTNNRPDLVDTAALGQCDGDEANSHAEEQTLQKRFQRRIRSALAPFRNPLTPRRDDEDQCNRGNGQANANTNKNRRSSVLREGGEGDEEDPPASSLAAAWGRRNSRSRGRRQSSGVPHHSLTAISGEEREGENNGNGEEFVGEAQEDAFDLAVGVLAAPQIAAPPASKMDLGASTTSPTRPLRPLQASDREGIVTCRAAAAEEEAEAALDNNDSSAAFSPREAQEDSAAPPMGLNPFQAASARLEADRWGASGRMGVSGSVLGPREDVAAAAANPLANGPTTSADERDNADGTDHLAHFEPLSPPMRLEASARGGEGNDGPAEDSCGAMLMMGGSTRLSAARRETTPSPLHHGVGIGPADHKDKASRRPLTVAQLNSQQMTPLVMADTFTANTNAVVTTQRDYEHNMPSPPLGRLSLCDEEGIGETLACSPRPSAEDELEEDNTDAFATAKKTPQRRHAAARYRSTAAYRESGRIDGGLHRFAVPRGFYAPMARNAFLQRNILPERWLAVLIPHALCLLVGLLLALQCALQTAVDDYTAGKFAEAQIGRPTGICAASFVGVMVVFLATGALIAALRPYRTPLTTVLSVGIHCCGALVALAAALGTDFSIRLVFLVITFIFLLARSSHFAAVWVWEHRRGREPLLVDVPPVTPPPPRDASQEGVGRREKIVLAEGAPPGDGDTSTDSAEEAERLAKRIVRAEDDPSTSASSSSDDDKGLNSGGLRLGRNAASTRPNRRTSGNGDDAFAKYDEDAEAEAEARRRAEAAAEEEAAAAELRREHEKKQRQRATLSRRLKEWRAAFQHINGRAPKIAEIRADSEMAVVYARYQALRAEMAEEGESNAAEASSPQPNQHPSASEEAAPSPQLAMAAVSLEDRALPTAPASPFMRPSATPTPRVVFIDDDGVDNAKAPTAISMLKKEGPHHLPSPSQPASPLMSNNHTLPRPPPLLVASGQGTGGAEETEPRSPLHFPLAAAGFGFASSRAPSTVSMADGGNVTPAPSALEGDGGTQVAGHHRASAASVSNPSPSISHGGHYNHSAEEAATLKSAINKELKQWKEAFVAANGGKKPKESDIRRDPAIGPRYELYLALKEMGGHHGVSAALEAAAEQGSGSGDAVGKREKRRSARSSAKASRQPSTVSSRGGGGDDAANASKRFGSRSGNHYHPYYQLQSHLASCTAPSGGDLSSAAPATAAARHLSTSATATLVHAHHHTSADISSRCSAGTGGSNDNDNDGSTSNGNNKKPFHPHNTSAGDNNSNNSNAGGGSCAALAPVASVMMPHSLRTVGNVTLTLVDLLGGGEAQSTAAFNNNAVAVAEAATGGATSSNEEGPQSAPRQPTSHDRDAGATVESVTIVSSESRPIIAPTAAAVGDISRLAADEAAALKSAINKELKQWKEAFVAANGGKKPKESDIRRDLAIGPRYELYLALKEMGGHQQQL